MSGREGLKEQKAGDREHIEQGFYFKFKVLQCKGLLAECCRGEKLGQNAHGRNKPGGQSSGVVIGAEEWAGVGEDKR